MLFAGWRLKVPPALVESNGGWEIGVTAWHSALSDHIRGTVYDGRPDLV